MDLKIHPTGLVWKQSAKKEPHISFKTFQNHRFLFFEMFEATSSLMSEYVISCSTLWCYKNRLSLQTLILNKFFKNSPNYFESRKPLIHNFGIALEAITVSRARLGDKTKGFYTFKSSYKTTTSTETVVYYPNKVCTMMEYNKCKCRILISVLQWYQLICESWLSQYITDQAAVDVHHSLSCHLVLFWTTGKIIPDLEPWKIDNCQENHTKLSLSKLFLTNV